MSSLYHARFFKGSVPEEIAIEAASEALWLWDNYDDLQEEFGRFEDQFSITEYNSLYNPRHIPEHATHINFFLGTESVRSHFAQEAPPLATILQNLGGKTRASRAAEFPANFTLNYTSPGQKVPPHIDTVSGLSRVVTLQGVGRFALECPVTQEVLFSCESATGDVHEFRNPTEESQRPKHYALTVGDENRVTLAFKKSD